MGYDVQLIFSVEVALVENYVENIVFHIVICIAVHLHVTASNIVAMSIFMETLKKRLILLIVCFSSQEKQSFYSF